MFFGIIIACIMRQKSTTFRMYMPIIRILGQ